MTKNAPFSQSQEGTSENIVKLTLSEEIEMRNVIMLMVAIVFASFCRAQAHQRPSLLNRGLNRNRLARTSSGEEKFKQNYPAGTNEYGRTWSVQCEYEKFMSENPSGTNRFEMTFDEHRRFFAIQEELKKMAQCKESFAKAKSQLETLSVLKDRSSELSEGAKALYEKEYAEVKTRFEKAKVDFELLEASLTPQKVAAYERQKRAMNALEAKAEAEKETEKLKAKKTLEEYEAMKWEIASKDVMSAIVSGMVRIPGKDYLIGKTEVTQAQWEAVMGKNPSRFKGADRPVENVSLKDCQEFVGKLNATPAAKTGRLRFRLPTADEWEFACRAGGKGDWGKRANGEDGPLDAIGWYGGNSDRETHPVAQKEPNAFGLYDMHGNVSEWCQDFDGSRSVCKGGGCQDDARRCSVAPSQAGLLGGLRRPGGSYGFRLAASEGDQAWNKAEMVSKETACDELSGWPCNVLDYSKFWWGRRGCIRVYGTNIQDSAKAYLRGAHVLSPRGKVRGNEECSTSFELATLCERTCHVVFSGGEGVAWESGKGTCLIDDFSCDDWRKYDEDGRLVKSGPQTKFAEYVWMTNQHAVISARLRAEWAKEHGLTLEQAEKRAQMLIAVIKSSSAVGQRPILGGSIVAQSQLPVQQVLTDKAQREAERAEQRQQLQAIQEELKRVREAKAAEE